MLSFLLDIDLYFWFIFDYQLKGFKEEWVPHKVTMTQSSVTLRISQRFSTEQIDNHFEYYWLYTPLFWVSLEVENITLLSTIPMCWHQKIVVYVLWNFATNAMVKSNVNVFHITFPIHYVTKINYLHI